MGGSNPYIEQVGAQPAVQPFSITFKTPEGTRDVQVDPSKIPYGQTGQPGSILDVAMGSGLDLEHACGGVCACSTCHVIVKEGLDSCNDATDDELDQLDESSRNHPAITISLPMRARRVNRLDRRNPRMEQKPGEGRALNFQPDSGIPRATVLWPALPQVLLHGLHG